MKEAIERLDRADISEKPQSLSHCQKPLFGAHRGCWVIVKFRVAHGREKHGIGIHADSESLFRKRVAGLFYGIYLADGVFIGDLMAELFTCGIHYGHALHGYLRPDSVARKYCDF